MKLKPLLRLCFYAAFLCVLQLSHAQTIVLPPTDFDPIPDYNVQQKLEFPTTQEWQFHKYGNTPVNYYTGTASVSIPIYVYKDSEFEIPITLDYASNGLMPNVPTGILGLGWSLNCGGDITRTVNGIEDEFNYDGLSPGPKRFGLLRLIADDKVESLPQFELDNLVTITDRFKESDGSSAFPYIVYPHPEHNECRPDRFHFRFLNHSGEFQYAPMTGRICKVYNSNHPWGEYAVENHIKTWKSGGRRNYSFIGNFDIRTGDGYVYTFGAGEDHTTLIDMGVVDGSSVKFTDDGQNGADFFHNINSFAKTSWPLNTIISPGGRTVKYKYDPGYYYYSYAMIPDYDSKSTDKLHDDNPEWQYSYFNYNQLFSCEERIAKRGYSRLQEIDFDNRIRVTFIYRSKDEEKCDLAGLGGFRLENCGLIREIRIDRIEPGGKTTRLRTCTLEYYESSGNPIYTLKKVTVSGEGVYQMDYYNATGFPNAGKRSADWWGFYSDSDSSPNPGYAMQGMLKKIGYPTGGHTVYEYEGHSYGHTIAKYTEECTKTFLAPCTTSLTGGLRIKSITDYTSEGNVALKRSYDYTLNGKSTGISLAYPRYIFGNGSSESTNFPKPYITNGAGVNYSIDRTHIEYSAVTERRSDGSKKVFFFSNFQDTPDQNRGAYIQDPVPFIDTIPIIAPVTRTLPVGNEDRYPVSYQSVRGKLLRTEYYNSDGKIVCKETNTYNKHALLANPTFECNNISRYFNYQIIDDYPLGKTSKIYYDDCRDSVVTDRFFSYNSKGQIFSTEIPDDAGNRIVTKIQYAGDVPNPDTTLKRIVDRNMFAYPYRKQVTLRKPDMSEMLLSGQKYTYFDFMLHFRETPFPVESTASTVLPGAVAWSSRQDFTFDSYLVAGNTYKYDWYGNIVQETDRSGFPTAYVWGHKGAFLVAKVVGATFEELQAIPDLGWEDRFIAANLTPDQINALYALKNVQVSVCDYDPYIGVIRTIDPARRETRYNYDSDGKLISVVDDKGIITDSYEYHIKNQ